MFHSHQVSSHTEIQSTRITRLIYQELHLTEPNTYLSCQNSSQTRCNLLAHYTLPQQSEPAVQCKPAIPPHYVRSPEAPISQLRFRRVHGVDIDLTSVPVVKLQNFHSVCRLLYATMKENSQPDVVASTMIGDLSNTLLLDGVICYLLFQSGLHMWKEIHES